ncbi:DUF262 domain-containing protein [Lyngbya confervoides]|uniref:DUF262 domain-containing HNH endonuclease family protein n=1 Tax=Lyngbya confervoides BDU141951 TaxID=1574623 RepID=A0ABD4T0M9_9CYAN|nr:DUF262 domain-containing protein [Lyngbya confervoides]MCM1981988.1 DUF262 domain-containing HNH endonuclease family protein [Lyngbya confervoides BDU141951]
MPANIDCSSQNLGKLLTSDDFCYSVPTFQRDYSWTKVEVDQLWQDITDTIKEKRSEHFMGAIVVKNSHKPEMLIDGQQRLVTISLLMCAIRDIAKNEKKEETLATLVSERYLGTMNMETYDLEPKLILNETNNDIYSEIVLKNREVEVLLKKARSKNLNQSNRLLIQAYLNLRTLVLTFIENQSNQIIALKQIVECIRSNFIVIVISVPDEANAYLIFETLNDRGLDLSVSDLLKNYLFSKAGNKLKEVKKKWEDMNFLVERFQLTKFIRHYWLSKYAVIREKDLYHTLRNHVRKQTDVIKFVNELTDSAEVYSSFFDSQSSLWHSSSNLRADIEALQVFKVNLCYSVLLAAWESVEEEVFRKILKMMVVISFRYNVICGSRPTPLEDAYSKAAIYIRDKKPKTAQSVFEILSDFYPDDKIFTDSFSHKVISNNPPLCRYILCSLNDYLMNSKELVTNSNGSDLNLEHILPRNPGRKWLLDINNKDYKLYINRLGNMTLLDSVPNRKLGNSLFESKMKEAYKKSSLRITKDLEKYSVWGISEIEDRQKELAKVACQVWRLDY